MGFVRISNIAFLWMASAFIVCAGFTAAQAVSPQCEAAMDHASGKYSACLLRADAHFARKGNATKFLASQERCGERFDRHTSRAIRRHGADECASTAQVFGMAYRTAIYADEVAQAASGSDVASRLYVQGATGGSLTETTMVLSGVDGSTAWFTDRPARESGREPTVDFLELFSEQGAGAFGTDPPNADLTCEVGGSTVNRAVALRDPVLEQGNLTYAVELLYDTNDGEAFVGLTCDSDAHLFIDSHNRCHPPNIEEAQRIFLHALHRKPPGSYHCDTASVENCYTDGCIYLPDCQRLCGEAYEDDRGACHFRTHDDYFEDMDENNKCAQDGYIESCPRKIRICMGRWWELRNDADDGEPW